MSNPAIRSASGVDPSVTIVSSSAEASGRPFSGASPYTGHLFIQIIHSSPRLKSRTQPTRFVEEALYIVMLIENILQLIGERFRQRHPGFLYARLYSTHRHCARRRCGVACDVWSADSSQNALRAVCMSIRVSAVPLRSWTTVHGGRLLLILPSYPIRIVLVCLRVSSYLLLYVPTTRLYNCMVGYFVVNSARRCVYYSFKITSQQLWCCRQTLFTVLWTAGLYKQVYTFA